MILYQKALQVEFIYLFIYFQSQQPLIIQKKKKKERENVKSAPITNFSIFFRH